MATEETQILPSDQPSSLPSYNITSSSSEDGSGKKRKSKFERARLSRSGSRLSRYIEADRTDLLDQLWTHILFTHHGLSLISLWTDGFQFPVTPFSNSHQSFSYSHLHSIQWPIPSSQALLGASQISPLQSELSQKCMAIECVKPVHLADMPQSSSELESDFLQLQSKVDKFSAIKGSAPYSENDDLISLKARGYSEEDGRSILEVGKKLGIHFIISDQAISEIQAAKVRDRSLSPSSSKRKRIVSPVHCSQQVRLRKRLRVRRVSK